MNKKLRNLVLKVEWRKTSANESERWQRLRVFDIADRCKIDIDDLECGEVYEFRIAAGSIWGYGPPGTEKSNGKFYEGSLINFCNINLNCFCLFTIFIYK